MPTETRTERSKERITGRQSRLKVRNEDGDEYYEVPITNVDWERTTETEEVQHNKSLNPTLTTTGLRYSGSFEYDGINDTVLDLLMQKAASEGDIERNRPIRVTITIKEYDHDTGDLLRTVTFRRCLVSEISRDIPADTVTSSSFSFDAEEMSITENGD